MSSQQLIAQTDRITSKERKVIDSLLGGGYSVNGIGEKLGRKANVIRYEVLANRDEDGVYRANSAHKKALERRSVSRKKPLLLDLEQHSKLRSDVESKLQKKWSPDQISGDLRLEEGVILSPGAIYNFIYSEAKKGNYLSYFLRTKRTARKKRSKKPRLRMYRRIKYQPWGEIIQQKAGIWENDTLNFDDKKHAIAIQISKASFYVKLSLIRHQHPEDLHNTWQDMLDTCEVSHLYIDQEPEGSGFRSFRRRTGVDFTICQGPWHKPTVENVCKLLRQYFPRCTESAQITPEMLQYVQEELNGRPRKLLGYATPEYVAESLGIISSPLL